MRLLFLPLCLALAACSSDPAPPADAGPADTGAPVDLGHDVLVVDVTEDRPAPVDMPPAPTDTGTDAAVKDWPFVDTGGDAPPDVTEDRPGPSDARCSPDAPVPCPCGLTSGTRECRADGTLGLCQCGVATDAGSDVPADVRVNCGAAGEPDRPCATHADCAACIPGAFGEPWCCRPNGYCGASSTRPTCE